MESKKEMSQLLKSFINGEFVIPKGDKKFNCIDPSNEEVYAQLQLANEQDVDIAVEFAQKAFKAYQYTKIEERLKILKSIKKNYEERQDDLVEAIIKELGCPYNLAKEAQIPLGLEHLNSSITNLKNYKFEIDYKKSKIKKVPIGVCGIITPWNWPIGVFMTKFLPAIATGCTIVWKPSEYSPLTSKVLAEIIGKSDLPAGVFNMLYGDGEVVGNAISKHKDIQMISFTGSKRAGVLVQKNGADNIKRIVQELGGKSPNIVLPSADVRLCTKSCIRNLMLNSGQTCAAPSRLIVENSKMGIVKESVKEVEKEITVGNPYSGAYIGPVVNKEQFKRVENYIKKGIEEGAEVVIGGLGKPDGLEKGYYVKPTVFINTKEDMKIVKEEIFGPVLVIQGYDTIEESIELACNTDYGLAAYIQETDTEELKKVADKIPAGQIYFNSAYRENDEIDVNLPFGGFKQSGNGREWGEFGFDEYIEYKALVGYYN